MKSQGRAERPVDIIYRRCPSHTTQGTRVMPSAANGEDFLCSLNKERDGRVVAIPHGRHGAEGPGNRIRLIKKIVWARCSRAFNPVAQCRLKRHLDKKIVSLQLYRQAIFRI